jgi:hypothetical protein
MVRVGGGKCTKHQSADSVRDERTCGRGGSEVWAEGRELYCKELPKRVHAGVGYDTTQSIFLFLCQVWVRPRAGSKLTAKRAVAAKGGVGVASWVAG